MSAIEGLEKEKEVNPPKPINLRVYGFFPINIPDEADVAVAKGRAKQFILDSTRDARTGQQTFVIEKVEVEQV